MRPRTKRRRPAQTDRGLPEHFRRDERRKRTERSERERERAIRLHDRQALQLAAGELIERVGRFARERGGAHERGDHVTIVGRCEQREELVPDTVAKKLRIAVGRIVDPFDAGAAQRVLHVASPHLDERANDPAAHRRDRCQPPNAGAFEEAHEDRLRLIVGRVAERDAASAEARGRRLQRGVARESRRRLEGASGRDANALHGDRHAKPTAERFHEGGVARRVRAELMIHVEHVELEPPLGREGPERDEQRD